MKKLILVIAVLFVSMAVLNAAPEYEDVKSYLEKQIKVFEDFNKSCAAVTDANGAAAAINGFSKGMKTLIPEIKALSAKYENMREMMRTNPPPSLASYTKKIEVLAQGMAPSMMKLAQYMADPAVQKAQKDFQTTMMELQKLGKKENQKKEPKKEK